MRKNNKLIKQDISNEEHLNFPGYPLYAPDEDITNKAKRVDINFDGTDTTETETSNLNDEVVNDDLIVSGKSELNKDDLEALGPKDLSLDMGDDEELLKHRIYPVDFSGKDIDVPGSELDDASEEIGEEDEENNSYSLGGDNHAD